MLNSSAVTFFFFEILSIWLFFQNYCIHNRVRRSTWQKKELKIFFTLLSMLYSSSMTFVFRNIFSSDYFSWIIAYIIVSDDRLGIKKLLFSTQTQKSEQKKVFLKLLNQSPMDARHCSRSRLPKKSKNRIFGHASIPWKILLDGHLHLKQKLIWRPFNEF